MRSKVRWIRKRPVQSGERWGVRVYVGGKQSYLKKPLTTTRTRRDGLANKSDGMTDWPGDYRILLSPQREAEHASCNSRPSTP